MGRIEWQIKRLYWLYSTQKRTNLQAVLYSMKNYTKVHLRYYNDILIM